MQARDVRRVLFADPLENHGPATRVPSEAVEQALNCPSGCIQSLERVQNAVEVRERTDRRRVRRDVRLVSSKHTDVLDALDRGEELIEKRLVADTPLAGDRLALAP
jgi:hypothetical protein